MTTNPCPECSRPAGDGTICRHCVATLRQNLAETPWLVTELNTAITKQTRFVASAGKVTMSGGDSAIIVNLAAAEAYSVLARALARWVSRLGRSRDAARFAAYDPTLASAWLLAHLEDVRRHDDAATILDQLVSARKGALHAVNRPAEKRYLGECGSTYKTGVGEEEVTCTETLWGKAGEPETKCRTCGFEWNTETRMATIRERALSGLEDRVMTATQAAETIVAYGIGKEKNPVKLRDRIRKWGSTRLLESPMDLSTPGQRRRPGYRLGDILGLVDRTDTLRHARGNQTESTG